MSVTKGQNRHQYENVTNSREIIFNANILNCSLVLVLIFIFFLYWFFIIYSYLIYLIYLTFICQRPIYYGPYIDMNYMFTPFPYPIIYRFNAEKWKNIYHILSQRHETVSVCQFAFSEAFT